MAKSKNCPCSGTNLDRLLRPALLVCLMKSEQHGYQLTKGLEDMAMFKSPAPDLTGIYRCLRDMEEEGLVTGSWEESDRGRARRRFQITPDGVVCLARWNQTIETYGAALKDLCGHMRRALAQNKGEKTQPKKCCAK
jgi:PadR family transcriptional regulator, regulatory protein PadR